MKDVILITPPPILLAMSELPMCDWSDVIWSLIGLIVFCSLLCLFHAFFVEKNKEKDCKLSDTERNRRMMESVYGQ